MASSVDDGIEFDREVFVGDVVVVLVVGLNSCGDRLAMLRVQDSIDDTRPGAR